MNILTNREEMIREMPQLKGQLNAAKLRHADHVDNIGINVQKVVAQVKLLRTMKIKKLTPTTAKLPKNERLICGDANPKLFNKRDIKQAEREYQEYLRNRKEPSS